MAREGKVPGRVVDAYSPVAADFFFSAVITDTLECKIFLEKWERIVWERENSLKDPHGSEWILNMWEGIGEAVSDNLR